MAGKMTSSPESSSPHAVGRALTALTYLALLAFGMAQGMLGTFFHDSGPAPLASIGFDLAIFATCLLGGWGTQRPTGGLAPAAGWFVVVFVLATASTSGGSVLIAASLAGEWFLFGGAVSAMAGLVVAYTVWSRPGRIAPR